MSSKVINSICGGGSGGSTRPNFSVNNYSEEKTSAGSTNEIQVYPVNTMNSWKIQDTEPSNPSLNDVWIKTGTGRYEFQPISGTNLTVPVSGASVWNGSSWDAKSTKCYYGNKWNPSFSKYIFKDGRFEYDYTLVGSAITVYSDRFRFSYDGTYSGSAGIIQTLTYSVFGSSDKNVYIKYKSNVSGTLQAIGGSGASSSMPVSTTNINQVSVQCTDETNSFVLFGWFNKQSSYYIDVYEWYFE